MRWPCSMRETTTLGVRRRAVERHVAEREVVRVETPHGPVRVKVKRWDGQVCGAAPEYEDCALYARVVRRAAARSLRDGPVHAFDIR